MREEISEDAKQALANRARLKALDRLRQDGAQSTAAVQRRVRALAQERNIPAADIHKLMYKRISTRDIGVFCKKYQVSYDWLLGGDLQGLQRMTQRHRAEATPESLKEKLARLSDSQREAVRKLVDHLTEAS